MDLNLRPINYENGLRCIDINLSDEIILCVDYRKMTPDIIVAFLKNLNLPFEVKTEEIFNHFKNLKDAGWYYHIRDYILTESRKSVDYLTQRLKYITDHYDVSINMEFINTVHKYEVSASYLYSEKIVNIKAYSNIMDCLDVLEVELDNLKSECKSMNDL